MKINAGRFITSLDSFGSFPGKGLPEFALVGKSNVGKSSMINHLCHNAKLAKTSAEPGKTRLINIYGIDNTFLFVDLPGYGFAKAPKAEKTKWAGMIEGYLTGSKNIRQAILLVDIRHDPTEDDKLMAAYLRNYTIPFFVCAAKADKVSGAKQRPSVMSISRILQVQPWDIIPFSAENGTGTDEILGRIGDLL